MDGLKFGIVIPSMRWPAAPAPRRPDSSPLPTMPGVRHRDIVPRDEVATAAYAYSGAAR